MQQYLNLLRTILSSGTDVKDRTGIGTRSLPGYWYQVKLEEDDNKIVHNYPLLTTKKVFLRGTFEELMWKLRGETNIKNLIAKNVHIWSEWPFKKWLEQTNQIKMFDWYADSEKTDYSNEWKARLKNFEEMIASDSNMYQWGELGPTYGHHMRNFGEVREDYDGDNRILVPGIDQLKDVYNRITNNPYDRRIIMSLWNPRDNFSTLLPPCPCFYQFFANQDGMLHLNVYQRSCDSFLGVPFNDSQDALLLILLAKLTGRKPGVFNHFFGDVHIYANHFKQVELQLTRQPRMLPSIRINREFNGDFESMLEAEWKDIELIGYDPYPVIKAPVAV
jgi:thymidylate synthase